MLSRGVVVVDLLLPFSIYGPPLIMGVAKAFPRPSQGARRPALCDERRPNLFR
jgi:hypothetical protein